MEEALGVEKGAFWRCRFRKRAGGVGKCVLRYSSVGVNFCRCGKEGLDERRVWLGVWENAETSPGSRQSVYEANMPALIAQLS